MHVTRRRTCLSNSCSVNTFGFRNSFEDDADGLSGVRISLDRWIDRSFRRSIYMMMRAMKRMLWVKGMDDDKEQTNRTVGFQDNY